MPHVFILPLLALAALAVYKLVSIVVTNRGNAAFAKQHGCQEVPTFPNGGFLGLRHVKEMMQADKDQRFPDLLVKRQGIMDERTGRRGTTFKGHFLGQLNYFTSDPENVKALLATQFADFDLGPARCGNMGTTLGSGIFTQDGKKWEHSRALLRPNFVRDQVSDLELEERHVQDLLKVMPINKDGWTAETNIQTLFFRLTIDSATEFLFGESVDSQLAEAAAEGQQIEGVTASQKDERAFSPNFDSAQLHLATRFRFGDLWWVYNPKGFQENNRIVNAFVKHYVDLALSKDAKELGKEKQKYVFLEELARQTRDPEELRAQMLNILLAGRDTTASLLSWTFHELLRHPEIFEKLRTTIIETFGSYNNPEDITFATLKNCQYLQMVLNESLRLWPVVPGNARRSNKPTTLPRGGGPDGSAPVFIPAETEVGYSVHVMMRRKDLWGEDADAFRPERFVGRKPGWEYLPFNGGPRICIGQQFALTEASYVMVRLLQRFDKIDCRPEELQGPVRSNLSLTSCPGRPVTLRMHVASEDDVTHWAWAALFGVEILTNFLLLCNQIL